MITGISPILRRQLTFIFLAKEILAPPRKTLFPIVNKKFADHQVDVFNEVRNTEVVAGGDGRCDSPGTQRNTALTA